MSANRIGKTGVMVPDYGFGTAPLGGMFQPCLPDQAMATLELAYASGLTLIDTAPWYGFGRAERYVGDFLRGKPKADWVLSTKVGRVFRAARGDVTNGYGFIDPLPFEVRYDYGYDAIMRSAEDSYLRLGLNKIDVLLIHDIGVYTHGAAVNAGHMRALFNGGLKALEELKSSGAIGAYGLGVNEVPVCLEILKRADLDVILLAGRYTLLDRSAEAELLDLCGEKSTSLFIGGALNSGILATGAKPGAYFDYGPAPEDVLAKVRELESLAARHGVPLAAPALQFGRRNPRVASVLIGAANPEMLARNLDLIRQNVPAALYDEANAHTLVAPPLGDAPVRQ